MSEHPFEKEDHHPYKVFGKQVIVDTVAYAANIPIRILNMKKLQEFNKDNAQGPLPLLPVDEFESFFKEITDIEKDRNQKADTENGTDVIIEEKVEKFFEDEKVSEIIDSFVEDIKDNINNTDIEVYDIAEVLNSAEKVIWRTKISNALPFHHYFRLNPYWRWYIYSWFVSHYEKINSAIDVKNHQTDDISNCKIDLALGIEGLIFYALPFQCSLDENKGGSINLKNSLKYTAIELQLIF